MAGERGGSIVLGALWMLVISVLLFWRPVVGPLIGGVVGGKAAGCVGHALAAVFLPAISAILLFLLGTVLTGVPLIGALAGTGVNMSYRTIALRGFLFDERLAETSR